MAMSTAGGGGGFFSGGLYTSGGGTALFLHTLNSRGGCGEKHGARGCSGTPPAPSSPGLPARPRPYLLGRPEDAALPVDLLVERVVEEGGRLRHLPEQLVGRRQPRPAPRAAFRRRRAGPRRALVGRGLVGLRVGAGAAVGREETQRVPSLRRHGGACAAARPARKPGPRPGFRPEAAGGGNGPDWQTDRLTTSGFF